MSSLSDLALIKKYLKDSTPSLWFLILNKIKKGFCYCSSKLQNNKNAVKKIMPIAVDLVDNMLGNAYFFLSNSYDLKMHRASPEEMLTMYPKLTTMILCFTENSKTYKIVDSYKSCDILKQKVILAELITVKNIEIMVAKLCKTILARLDTDEATIAVEIPPFIDNKEEFKAENCIVAYARALQAHLANLRINYNKKITLLLFISPETDYNKALLHNKSYMLAKKMLSLISIEAQVAYISSIISKVNYLHLTRVNILEDISNTESKIADTQSTTLITPASKQAKKCIVSGFQEIIDRYGSEDEFINAIIAKITAIPSINGKINFSTYIPDFEGVRIGNTEFILQLRLHDDFLDTRKNDNTLDYIMENSTNFKHILEDVICDTQLMEQDTFTQTFTDVNGNNVTEINPAFIFYHKFNFVADMDIINLNNAKYLQAFGILIFKREVTKFIFSHHKQVLTTKYLNNLIQNRNIDTNKQQKVLIRATATIGLPSEYENVLINSACFKKIASELKEMDRVCSVKDMVWIISLLLSVDVHKVKQLI